MLLRASRAARVLQPRIGRTVLSAPALQFIPASLSRALSTAAAAEEQPQLKITDRCAKVCGKIRQTYNQRHCKALQNSSDWVATLVHCVSGSSVLSS